MITRNAWLYPVTKSSSPSLRLLCFPYAGAGAQVFCSWATALPANVDVWALQTPGRGPRVREMPLRSIPELASGAAANISEILDVPYAFFGHSMGALLAFEVARVLSLSNSPAPVHLLLSGTGAPDLPAVSGPIHHLPERPFIERIQEFNGTPREVFKNPELMAVLLPALRADFEASETYRCGDKPPLDIPITLFAGENDPDTPLCYLESWSRYTSRQLNTFRFPGGHFFLHTSSTAFLACLGQVLNGITRELTVPSR